MKIAIATLCLYSLAYVAVAGNKGPEVHFIERKKTIVKAFDVKPEETLSIDNSYGDVKVQLWDKQSVRVEITITANAATEEKVNDAINSVSITEKKSDGVVGLHTVIDWAAQKKGWGVRKGNNSLRIDYLVQMPKRTPLRLENSFGDTDIARFLAPLKVKSSYGSFRAEDLGNTINDILIMYGSAAIGHMSTGKLESRYSDVKLEKVNSLSLVNKFGSLKIGEVGSLTADIDYSGARIERLKEKGTVKLSFSNNFLINHSTADEIDINASYSSVVLPAQSPARFDISVSYGDFQYPKNNTISIINVSENSRTKQYEANTGTDPKPSVIRVVSKYGNVRLKE